MNEKHLIIAKHLIVLEKARKARKNGNRNMVKILKAIGPDGMWQTYVKPRLEGGK
jgi:hypothetical protein